MFSSLQIEFNLYNPVDHHPFDQELEDAIWCVEDEE